MSSGSGNSDSSQVVWLDYHRKNIGASVLMPFNEGGSRHLEFRSDKGPLYEYLQYDTSSKKFFPGFEFQIRKSNVSFDVAYQDSSDTTFVRLSKLFATRNGYLLPEIRTKLGSTSYIGFGLAFCGEDGGGEMKKYPVNVFFVNATHLPSPESFYFVAQRRTFREHGGSP